MFEKYQKQFLHQISSRYNISEATQRAYLATPRHLFVQRYHPSENLEWVEVGEDNLEEHLAILYANRALDLLSMGDTKHPLISEYH